MTGVEQFIENNFSEPDSTFSSCLNLIVYGYLLLEKEQKYSRSEIFNTTTKIRGKKAKKVELEDYLRNDLVVKYINPNRAIFGLNYYLFHSGVEEFSQNIKTGILDIKVCSPLYNGNVYYIFECKRLNREIVDNYVKEGILRFINGQYYPNEENSIAGMISFLESANSQNKIACNSVYDEIGTLFTKYNNQIRIRGKLEKYGLNSNEYKQVREFKYIFKSVHQKLNNGTINIFHIILDYNHIVIV